MEKKNEADKKVSSSHTTHRHHTSLLGAYYQKAATPHHARSHTARIALTVSGLFFLAIGVINGALYIWVVTCPDGPVTPIENAVEFLTFILGLIIAITGWNLLSANIRKTK